MTRRNLPAYNHILMTRSNDTSQTFNHRHLIGLRFLSKQDLQLILKQAKSFKDLFDRPIKQVPTLRGKTVMNLFFEPSTRTRLSFETATRLIGATPMNMDVSTSSVQKGESLFDTVQNLAAMGVDAFVIRHPYGGASQFVADHFDIPVINGGDGVHEHPTQGLLDIFTLQEKLGDLAKKRILIWGDIAHSRVARSNIWALTKLGAEVYVGGPQTLIPSGIESLGATVIKDFDLAIEAMDAINILRVQFERQDTGYFPSIREYKSRFRVTEERLKNAKESLIILHPGPINRGIEIESQVADGKRSVILDQVTNGVAIRMAILYMLLTGKK